MTDKRRDFNKLGELLEEISINHGLTYSEIFLQVKKKDSIPATIFVKQLSPLEAVAKYLIENEERSIQDTADILKRSIKTIWQAHNSAKKKNPPYLDIQPTNFQIPIKKFQNRKFTVFEISIAYLIEKYNLRYSDIARLIHRNERTIWTVYNRYKKKKGGKN